MLNVISVADARELIRDRFLRNAVRKTETVPLGQCAGRTAAEDVISRENVPAFTRSTVDGFALIAADTYGAGENIPSMLTMTGEILMGERTELSVKRGECVRIPTGGMLPANADAVIPVENTENGGGDLCLICKPVSPLENVISAGDDVRAGQPVISAGTVLKTVHTGVLASLGVAKINVYKKPVAGILSTGDEVIDITRAPDVGQVRDVNSHLLASLLAAAGAECIRYGIVKDDRESIYGAVKKAAEECDIVLISGGSSAGTRDMTSDIIGELGEVYAHGLAMKPGKPTIIGQIGGKAVFGLPGHPAASFFVAEALVKPLAAALGGKELRTVSRAFPAAENVPSNNGREEYVCVKITDGKAVPVYGKSGLVSMLACSDGYIMIGRDTEGIKKGDTAEVVFWE